MRSFLKRIIAALCSGYIIVFYGELMFWATPEREGMDLIGIAAMWLMYSIMAYPFLCVVSLFRVRSPWAVFLAGAFYGWFEEGIVVQTTYGSADTPFPMSISFTALAWHAMIDIWMGWYLVRRILARNHYLATAALAGAIGLFYGLWAIFWWNEPPPAMKDLLDSGRRDVLFARFTFFTFGSTALLVLAHWLYQRVQLTEFVPSKIEMGIFGALVIFYYAFITVPAAPKALWVLPPLMGLTFWSLFKNRRTEKRANAIVAYPEKIKPLNYLLLFTIPMVACFIYQLALIHHWRFPTNFIFYYVATPLGALFWITALVICGRRGKSG